MSKVTTYTCDRCGASSTDVEELEILEVRIVWYPNYRYNKSNQADDYKNRKADWCKNCRVELGIIDPDVHRLEVTPIEPPPTLEDLVREIVKETLSEA